MILDERIKPEFLPQHLAIIMDGNGRWAKKQGMLRVFGHENGTQSVRTTVEVCARLGIPYLTLYAFSTENWNRPKMEVDALMRLLASSLENELPTLMKNGIRLNSIGTLDRLPEKARKKISEVIEATKENKRMTLTLALSYGSREELVSTFKALATKVKNNIISESDIDEEMINNHLYTNDLPDVDLLVRTSGEQRISNFMLWQIAYAELYFTEVLWPDFTAEELQKALLSYQQRERRFGKTSEQLK